MRGEIYRLKANPKARGHVQKGPRFGVVVQSDAMDLLSTCIIAPTTASANVAPTRFRPQITIPDHGECRVLVEQMLTVDRNFLGELVGNLTRAELDEVSYAVRLVLDLP